MKETFCLLFLFLASAALPAGESLILVVGDSIGAAHGMPLEKGWVALLQRRLEEQGGAWKVVNASTSGDTTANGLRRLPALLERHRPEVVILELGGNDGLRGLSLAQMERNLERMIELTRAVGSRVLLLGIQLPPNYGERYTSAFAEVYRKLARRLDVPLVPSIVRGIGDDPGLMQADGIHPNAKAQPAILALIWPRLRPLLTGLQAAQRAAQ